MKPHVCEYLANHSMEQLFAQHGVVCSARDGDVLFSLNYDQIASKPSPLVNECRGLVLSRRDGVPVTQAQIKGEEPVGPTEVMARPFDRFFNYGDVNAARIDFDDAGTRFFEKLDGTLCILYYDRHRSCWNIATRSVPLANRPLNGWGDLTFRDLFEQALCQTTGTEVSLDSWASGMDKGITWCFELTTPLNRIVVRYDEYRIHLLGARSNETGQEYSLEEIGQQAKGVPPCPSHPLSNLSELLDFVGSKGPLEQEGIVVRDSKFRRVKVKSVAYVAYNRVRDATANSPRAVMELILSDKLDDVVDVLDANIRDKALQMADGMRSLLKRTEEDWIACSEAARLSPENPRKGFALEAQKRKAWIPALMDRFLGRVEDTRGYIESKKDKATGMWPDGFLDGLVASCSS